MIFKKFDLEDEVIINNTFDKKLDDQHGVIIGKTLYGFYVVLLEHIYEKENVFTGEKFKNRAIVLPEHCLEKTIKKFN